MNSGVTSLTAVMARTDLGGEAYVAKYGEEEYVQLVSAYSLYVGAASIVMALVGFGALAQKVPGAVKTGFKVREFIPPLVGLLIAQDFKLTIFCSGAVN